MDNDTTVRSDPDHPVDQATDILDAENKGLNDPEDANSEHGDQTPAPGKSGGFDPAFKTEDGPGEGSNAPTGDLSDLTGDEPGDPDMDDDEDFGTDEDDDDSGELDFGDDDGEDGSDDPS
jgi:hypothetical protein